MSSDINKKGILGGLDEESILTILQYTPNVELTESKSLILFIFSVGRDYSRCVHHLLEKYSYSPHIVENSFFFSCRTGRENCVSVFITKKHIDPGVRNDKALGICCTAGHTNCVKILLQDYRVDPSVNQNKVLKVVTQAGHEDIFRLLLRHPKVDPRDRNHDFLRKACFLGRKEIVRMLLDDERVDPAVNLNEPVTLACYEGHVEILEMLLNDERVNPADQDNAALRLAVSQRKIQIVRILLGDDRVNPASKNNEALRNSVKSGNFEMCRLLCEHPLVLASPNLQEMSQLSEELKFPKIGEMIRQLPSLEKKYKRAKDQLEKYQGRLRRTHSWKKMKELVSTMKRESILYKSTVLTYENQEKLFVTQKMIDLGNLIESELISFYERHLELSKDKNETRIYIGEMRPYTIPGGDSEGQNEDGDTICDDHTTSNSSPTKQGNESSGSSSTTAEETSTYSYYENPLLPVEDPRTTINFHKLRTESQNFIPHGRGKIYIERSRAMGVYLQRMKAIFEGEFEDGKKCGKGKEYFPSSQGKLEFQGLFRANRRHGPGILFEKDGETIQVKGEWRNGKLYRIDIEDVFLERIDYSKIKKMLRRENRIGQGAYGEVYKVIYNKRKYACKVLNTQDMDYSVMSIVRKNTEKMLKLCTSLSHPHTIKVYGMFDGDEGEIGYLMELCECSYQEVIGRENLTMSEKMRLLYQTAVAMQYLHENSVMHRDLKWGNVLKDSMGDIKITDFEFAKVDETGWRSSAMNSTILGTPVYLAPEILEKDYTKKCDVYSFGMMIYCLYFDTLRPYSGKIDQMNCGICGKVITKPTFLVHVSECNLRPNIHWDSVPKEWIWLMDLMVLSWDGEKEKRPSFNQIVEVIRSNMEHTEGFTMVSILEKSDVVVRKYIMKNLNGRDKKKLLISSSSSSSTPSTPTNNSQQDELSESEDEEEEEEEGEVVVSEIIDGIEEEDEDEWHNNDTTTTSSSTPGTDYEEYLKEQRVEKFLLMESTVQAIIEIIIRKWKLRDPKTIKRIFVVLKYEKYRKIVKSFVSNNNIIMEQEEEKEPLVTATTTPLTPITPNNAMDITFKNLSKDEEIQERKNRRRNSKKRKRSRKLVLLENNEQVKKFVDSESIIIVEFYEEMMPNSITNSTTTPVSSSTNNNVNKKLKEENESLKEELKLMKLNNETLKEQVSENEKNLESSKLENVKWMDDNSRLKRKLQFMKRYLEKKLKVLDQLDQIINNMHKQD